jgi:putative endonuclease
MKTYYVYIVTNRIRTLYTGVTNNLVRRVFHHERKLLPGFTRRYHIDRLVYYETFGDIRAALHREKQIKGWLRAKKVVLIVSTNPTWRDLSQDWYGKQECGGPSQSPPRAK